MAPVTIIYLYKNNEHSRWNKFHPFFWQVNKEVLRIKIERGITGIFGTILRKGRKKKSESENSRFSAVDFHEISYLTRTW